MMTIILLFIGCSNKPFDVISGKEQPILEDVLISNYEDGIVPIDDIETHPLVQDHFSWYTHLISPNGSPVMILAQIGASRAHILQVRNHLEFGLMDHGIDDTIEMDLLFDTVADNQATILLFDELANESAAASDGILDLDWWVYSQLLEDTVLPGSDGWLNNDAVDLTLSSVYRLIVQTGWSALHSNFQNQLLARSNQAIVSGLWQPNSSEQSNWSAPEQSSIYLSQLVGIDFGHWSHSTDPWSGSWSINNRTAILEADPEALELLRSLVPEFYTQVIMLEAELSQSVSLTFDSNRPESAKSQYWIDVMLDGNNDIDLFGNTQDNFLAGNAGSNRLVGGEGIDTVRFQGPKSEYDIQSTANGFLLFDEDLNRDGADEIIDFEFVEFSDGLIEIETLMNR
ncbi:MAG: hypothetical protein ACON4U_04095 [Myxococcota bacterium]